jgi:hypothetical protein
MFEQLKELVNSFEIPQKNYRVTKENRQRLQLIKLEAQRLREVLAEMAKSKTFEK